jgi:DNA repair protein RecO (recombination protein O)
MEKTLKGIVLRYTHFGETSAILNVLTKNRGISSVLMHGVKKHGGNYGIGAVVEWQIPKRYVDKPEDLAKTSKYDILDNYSFGGDVEKVALRDCAIELILQVIPQENGDTRELFVLLERYFKYLRKADCDIFFGFWLFCVRLAEFLGYKINLETCIDCGNALSFSFLSRQDGGFLCHNCHEKPNWRGEILQILSKGSANICETMRNFSEKEKFFVTEQLISYIQHHCGKKEKPLNSFDFFCRFANFS